MANEVTLKVKVKIFVFNVFIPILIGFTYYYLFCPDTMVVKKIDAIFAFRYHIKIPNSNLVFKFIRNYLLDAIWSYSLTNCLFIILDKTLNAHKKSIILSIFLSVIMELLQLTNIVKGTFDIFDIIVEVIAILLASIIIGKCLKGENKNEKENF